MQSTFRPEWLNFGCLRSLAALAILSTAALAQVEWIPSTDAIAANGVAVTTDGYRVCRATVSGQTVLGRTLGNGCEVVVGNATIGFSRSLVTTHEIAIGLTVWSATPIPNVNPIAGASAGVVVLRPCRYHEFAGWVRSDDAICWYVEDGKPLGATVFELLYPIDPATTLRVLSSKGLCVTPFGGFVTLQGCAFAADLLQSARVETVVPGIYKLSLGVGQCLIPDSAVNVAMGTCSSSLAWLKIFDENGQGAFRIQFHATGNFLQAQTAFVPLVQAASNLNPGQRFEIRTFADHARRMKLITYNIMLLSYDVLSTTTWFSSFARQRNCTASVPGGAVRRE